MKTNWLLTLFLSLALVACGSGAGDDLDKFMKDNATDMRVKIDPLPAVKLYVPWQYNADATLNDPFRARKAQAVKSGGLQPNLNRPKEPLEAFPVESINYVGSLSRAKLKFALIRTPDNAIQQVKVGNYLGLNFGLVTEINDTAVVVKEIVQDELSGDWTERTSSINLQE